NSAGADGLFYGNVSFFWKQLIAVAGAAVYAFVFTYVMLYLINKVTPVKTSESDENSGLDEAQHGEVAYLH
ncbi:MAG: ammonium transporter, partial [Elusimicrobia bacterium]|nr:ammonium transporter [Elusimicrobiota bacterium]